MPHLQDVSDLPPVVLVERRHHRDRRAFWRGGRRNTDWINRPIGGWRHVEQRFSTWRQWLAKVPIVGLMV
jgi:hypothetical protein